MDRDQWEAGKLLAAARDKKGMSKRNAARTLGMSDSWLRKAELGYYIHNGERKTFTPSPEALAKYAHLVGLNPATILKMAGHTDTTAATLPTMREEAETLIANLADEQLPVAVAYLTGLRDGLAQR